MGHFFFFSYARNDTQDKFLESFYDDLVVEVSGRLGISPDLTGFLDTGMPPGSLWAEKTAQALATCKVFIPVYSPSFFRSSYCGKEWHYFKQRLDRSNASTELILPVWWLPAGSQLPDSVESVQDPRDGFGDEFRNHGLRFLRQLKRNRADYQQFLATFTAQVVAAAERHPLGNGEILDLRNCPDAFLSPTGTATGVVKGSEPSRGGPKWVRFIILVGTQEQMRQHRARLDYYDNDWDGWRPYFPTLDDPVGMHAQRLAGAQRLYSDLKVADSSLLTLVREAEERREIVVLLIDSWAAKIEGYSALLDEYDRQQFDNVAVIVPTNISDEETAEHIGELREALFKRLRRSMHNNFQLFREDTGTVDEFERALQQVIVEVRRRIVEENPPERRAGAHGEDPLPQPRISGPGA